MSVTPDAPLSGTGTPSAYETPRRYNRRAHERWQMIDPGQPRLADLAELARQAMRDHGLDPDMPPEAIRELDEIRGPANEADPSIRDLRTLLWCSIDDDDSRDLDQLTVAQSAD